MKIETGMIQKCRCRGTGEFGVFFLVFFPFLTSFMPVSFVTPATHCYLALSFLAFIIYLYYCTISINSTCTCNCDILGGVKVRDSDRIHVLI
jgi:hypothetical protein